MHLWIFALRDALRFFFDEVKASQHTKQAFDLLKAFAHAVRAAVERDPRETGVPSSKGTI